MSAAPLAITFHPEQVHPLLGPGPAKAELGKSEGRCEGATCSR